MRAAQLRYMDPGTDTRYQVSTLPILSPKRTRICRWPPFKLAFALQLNRSIVLYLYTGLVPVQQILGWNHRCVEYCTYGTCEIGVFLGWSKGGERVQ